MPLQMEGKGCVVVTGVSTGIGYGLLDFLAAEGYHVLGSVRKSEDAERLKSKFRSRFTPLLFDVTDESAVCKAAKQAGSETVRALPFLRTV